MTTFLLLKSKVAECHYGPIEFDRIMEMIYSDWNQRVVVKDLHRYLSSRTATMVCVIKAYSTFLFFQSAKYHISGS